MYPKRKHTSARSDVWTRPLEATCCKTGRRVVVGSTILERLRAAFCPCRWGLVLSRCNSAVGPSSHRHAHCSRQDQPGTYAPRQGLCVCCDGSFEAQDVGPVCLSCCPRCRAMSCMGSKVECICAEPGSAPLRPKAPLWVGGSGGESRDVHPIFLA